MPKLMPSLTSSMQAVAGVCQLHASTIRHTSDMWQGAPAAPPLPVCRWCVRGTPRAGVPPAKAGGMGLSGRYSPESLMVQGLSVRQPRRSALDAPAGALAGWTPATSAPLAFARLRLAARSASGLPCTPGGAPCGACPPLSAGGASMRRAACCAGYARPCFRRLARRFAAFAPAASASLRSPRLGHACSGASRRHDGMPGPERATRESGGQAPPTADAPLRLRLRFARSPGGGKPPAKVAGAGAPAARRASLARGPSGDRRFPPPSAIRAWARSRLRALGKTLRRLRLLALPRPALARRRRAACGGRCAPVCLAARLPLRSRRCARSLRASLARRCALDPASLVSRSLASSAGRYAAAAGRWRSSRRAVVLSGVSPSLAVILPVVAAQASASLGSQGTRSRQPGGLRHILACGSVFLARPCGRYAPAVMPECNSPPFGTLRRRASRGGSEGQDFNDQRS